MELEEYVTFEADFPDDSVWSESGDAVIPAGRAIAEYLRSSLSERGLRCSAPRQHSFYGWAFDIACRGKALWCVLQYAEPWLLICEARRSLRERLLGRRSSAEHRQTLKMLAEALAADARFTSIRWYTRAAYEARGGSPH